MVKKLIKYIRQDMKLRSKLLLIQLLTVLIPALITASIFYNSFYKSTTKTVLDACLNTVNTEGRQIEDEIVRMMEISDIISNTDLLQQILTISEEDLLKAAESDTDGVASIDFLDIYKAILNARIEDSQISSIRIYCDGPADLLNELGTRFSEEPFFQPISQIEYSYWKTIMDISNESSRLFPGYYLLEQERENYGRMSYVQKVNYSRDGEWKEAYVVIYRSDEMFEGLTGKDEGQSGEFACVIDSRNVIVTPYAQNEDIGLYVVNYEDLDTEFPETGKFYSGTYGKEPVYVCRYDFSNADWAMIWVIPRKEIIGESQELLIKVLGTYALLMLLGFAAAMSISWSMLKRIYILRAQMENVKSGRPAVLEGETGKDEIGILQDTYNYMVTQVNDSVDREIRSQAEMNEMKIEVLRAQIDPHFLYNTLDLLCGLSRMGETDKVEELVSSLTKFYRLSLNKGERFSTVEHEMQLAESYMNIMNMRFGNSISFVADISEEIMDYSIPVLIFQPFLENAVIHGVMETETHSGNISLTGWKEEKNLIFMISDDGAGMDEDTLKAVMEGKYSKGKGSNIGLSNTMRRIMLIYGEGKGSVNYRSAPGKGTDVEITVPVADEIYVEEV